jgi:hypothetical protein
MQGIEAALSWVDGSAAGAKTDNSKPNMVLATTSDGGQIVVVTALGKDGNCWSIAQVNDPADSAFEGTSYNKSATAAGPPVNCVSAAAPTVAPTAGSAGNFAAGATWYTSF